MIRVGYVRDKKFVHSEVKELPADFDGKLMGKDQDGNFLYFTWEAVNYFHRVRMAQSVDPPWHLDPTYNLRNKKWSRLNQERKQK